ncbi:LysR family transcriptional regulator [Bradyrhizobium sp. U87765 SZCCT0131]|uniref:LysR family transcriptional regulator n=1 Tax=unclassified Bradyrhizobium TaxID=2631580 RepID=UPI001BAC2274|nr:MULTISPECIES: LysR family transcriptional regulator [unclassified Bradyrhizobium]MBR1221061.1 LysR family transcriptional regulator [Bradyrhizobium sp. U87765 SZCCT0131]MBR1260119.1 LysR family transcriptional regulator [Bradyrhizobium sp. U87765 SZCCT0134]MBR1307632.1 LysR family transcriptional regulator [Bradyrhizobium sp. U87765 SZCCT0110]MBR1321586.1 LysR family transcriptional regulator [Bradyrhizobium sp. U87765 SZCCT0109]MBR1349899.1 LysR family transcriptional regulator [Bradyrhizo
MNATLRQLEAFALAYRLGSLTRAAAEMHLTQSAVSLLVRQLEEQWQARLFDRTTRALNPTPAADEAIVWVERILGELRGLANHMRGLGDKSIGRVAFAVTAGVASALMPRVLKRFRNAHPAIRIQMLDVGADQLIPKILSGEAEFSIGTVENDNPDIALETLISDRLSAIAPRDGTFETRAEMSWDDLRRYATISVPQGTSIRHLIDTALAADGRVFTPALETSLLNTALSMTAHGLGVSVLPAYLVPMLQFPDLVAVPLVDPVVRRNLSLITRSGRSLSAASRSFVEVAKAVIVGA